MIQHGDEILKRMKTFNYNPKLSATQFSEKPLPELHKLAELLYRADAMQNPKAPWIKCLFPINQHALTQGDYDEDYFTRIQEAEHTHERSHESLSYGQREAKALEMASLMESRKQGSLNKLSFLMSMKEKADPNDPECLYARLAKRLPQSLREYQAFLTPEWAVAVRKRKEEITEWYMTEPRRRMYWALDKHLVPWCWNMLRGVEQAIETVNTNGWDDSLRDEYETEEQVFKTWKSSEQLYKMFLFVALFAMSDKLLRDSSWELVHCMCDVMRAHYEADGSASGFSFLMEEWDSPERMFMLGETDSLWWEDMPFTKVG